jgi:hypothetical protein
MKNHKYCTLVKLGTGADQRDAALPKEGGRIVLKAHHHETQRDKFFSALVNGTASEPSWASDHSIQLTITVYGDDVIDYLEPGDAFVLWRGHDIGRGVISRRLSFWATAP